MTITPSKDPTSAPVRTPVLLELPLLELGDVEGRVVTTTAAAVPFPTSELAKTNTMYLWK